MHEMAIVQSVVDAVCGHARGRQVHRVDLEVGVLCAVVPDAMRFCFELAVEGTVAEGAALVIDQIPGRAVCHCCGAEFVLRDLIVLCDGCGSADVEIRSGRELRIRTMEVNDTCAQPVDVATRTDR